MSGQVTHRRDPETGRMIQIVSAAELRRILRRDGESLARPDGFGDDDEWDVDASGHEAQP